MMVSVVLPTYNGASRKYLDAAIKSVLNQSFRDYELIIVDDGSTDNTADICAKYKKRGNIKYVFQQNKGLSGARNTGIKNAEGRFLCFIDDDDIWLSEKLEKQITFFKENDNEKIGMIFSSVELINWRDEKIGIQSHNADGNIYEKLFYENIVDSPSSVMIRREVIDKVGMFKEEMRSCEDYDMWLRIAKEYLIFSMNEVLVKYRVHKNKMSGDLKKMERFHFSALDDAFNNAPEDIRKNRSKILGYSYDLFAGKYFSSGDYGEFEKFYRKSSEAGHSVSLKLKLLYFSSKVPGLFFLKTKIKKRLVK